jgi:5-methylcytosine-specific restriction endonuclease McrA
LIKKCAAATSAGFRDSGFSDCTRAATFTTENELAKRLTSRSTLSSRFAVANEACGADDWMVPACRFCKSTDKKLIKAHIIPRSIFRLLSVGLLVSVGMVLLSRRIYPPASLKSYDDNLKIE